MEPAHEINPNSAPAAAGLALALSLAGEAERPVELLRRAMGLSPRDPEAPSFSTFLARAHLVAGHHEEAVGFARQAIALEPGIAAGHRLLIIVLHVLGRLDEARAAARRFRAIAPAAAHVFPDMARRLWGGAAMGERIVRALREAGLPE